MLAIKTMFVAITSIQRKEGNIYPRAVVTVLLSGQLFIPLLMLMRKYISNANNIASLSASIVISIAVIHVITRSASNLRMQDNRELGLRIKIMVALFVPTVVIAWIARDFPWLSLLIYIAYAILPLRKILNLPIDG